MRIPVGVRLSFWRSGRSPVTLSKTGKRELTGPEEMAKKKSEEAAEVEKAYKSMLKNTGGNTSTKSNPWGSIRGDQVKQGPSTKSSK
jgi:hypothetical protein